MNMNTEKTNRGRRIRAIRRQLGVSQVQFGEMLGGLSKGSISGYEAGDTNPPPEVLVEIARLGKTTTDHLLAGVPAITENREGRRPAEIQATIQPGGKAAARKLEDASKRPTMRNPLLRQIVAWMDEYFEGELEAHAFYLHEELRQHHPSFASFVERNRPEEFTRTQATEKESKAASA